MYQASTAGASTATSDTGLIVGMVFLVLIIVIVVLVLVFLWKTGRLSPLVAAATSRCCRNRVREGSGDKAAIISETYVLIKDFFSKPRFIFYNILYKTIGISVRCF